MRLASALAIIAFASPAFAAGSTPVGFDPAWMGVPSTHFSALDRATAIRTLPAHIATIPADIFIKMVGSASAAERRDIAVNEIAQGRDQDFRTALEDLRDAQRAYASAAGQDGDARGQRFVALLERVVDNSGRSAVREPSLADDAALSQVYDRVIRDASDEKLLGIEASETAWVAYRDAFDRFASLMDRPDLARLVRDELAQRRIDELEGKISR